MADPADESPDDISVYRLAEQVLEGMPRTDAASIRKVFRS